MTDILGIILISLGLIFDFLGCLGLIRLPDVYNRLQASTKCVTFGTCSIMFGTFLILGFSAAGVKSLLCIGFLALTAPVSAHALSRAAHISGIKLWNPSRSVSLVLSFSFYYSIPQPPNLIPCIPSSLSPPFSYLSPIPSPYLIPFSKHTCLHSTTPQRPIIY